MNLRPSPAHWFELIVPRADADDAMEALARIGRVQFEWKGDQGDVASVRETLLPPAGGGIGQ
jgi:hypothetical protein